jgi:hypothetical protein
MRTARVAGAVLLALLAAAAPGRTWQVNRTLRRAVPVGAMPRIVVEHRYGSVQISGQESRTAAVEARLRVQAGAEQAAREFADAVELLVGPRADSTVITVFYPTPEEPDPTLSYETELVMRIPATSALAVRSSFGDVRLVGLVGGSDIEVRYGNVELEGCRRADVVARHGGLLLVDVEGPVKVDHSYGDVVLRNTSGRVAVENRYGVVDADGPNGDLQVVNRFGNVAARGGQGRLAIENHYGRVVAWIDRPGLDLLNLVSQMGQVELNVGAGLPYRLGGSARSGQVTSGLPLLVNEQADGVRVSGSQGTGGPAIQLDGLWSDFVIQPGPESAESTGR